MEPLSDERERRIASHPDDPTAPLADRLLLALGMWPKYVDDMGVDAVLDAAVMIRTKAHQFPMVCEDYGTVSEERDSLRRTVELQGDVVSAARDVVEADGADYGAVSYLPKDGCRCASHLLIAALARLDAEPEGERCNLEPGCVLGKDHLPEECLVPAEPEGGEG